MSDSGHGGDAASTSRRRRRPDPTPAQRALGLLVRREHSRKELTRKLLGRGVEAGDAQAAVDRLAAAGWQDDARFAESVLRNRAASSYGPRHIRAELGSHGLPEELIEAVMDGFDGDWRANARDFVMRRHPAALAGDRTAQRKAADLLLRRGFGMEQVRAALGGLRDEE